MKRLSGDHIAAPGFEIEVRGQVQRLSAGDRTHIEIFGPAVVASRRLDDHVVAHRARVRDPAAVGGEFRAGILVAVVREARELPVDRHCEEVGAAKCQFVENRAIIGSEQERTAIGSPLNVGIRVG